MWRPRSAFGSCAAESKSYPFYHRPCVISVNNRIARNNSSVSFQLTCLGYKLVRLEFDSWHQQEPVFFSTTYSLVLLSTHTPIQWVPAFLTGVNRLGCEADSHLYLGEVKNEWKYLSSHPICLHNVKRRSLPLPVSLNATYGAVIV